MSDPEGNEIAAISEHFYIDPPATPRVRVLGPFRVPPGTWLLGVVHVESLTSRGRLWLDFAEARDDGSWEDLLSLFTDRPGKSLVTVPPARGRQVRITLMAQADAHAQGHLELLVLPYNMPAPLRPAPGERDCDGSVCPRAVVPLAPQLPDPPEIELPPGFEVASGIPAFSKGGVR
ncbi:MAG: hypothetical protein HYY18_10500 [Planctomycetes bacterium]|nr:hypothetical protein [Planctomycetota bacterium]